MEFILCNGKQTRWMRDDPPVKCKQLVRVEGEILIRRTQRLFGHNIVITNNKLIISHSDCWQDIGDPKGICADLLRVVNFFGSISYTILLGDVFYTHKLADKITDSEDDLMFFMNKSDILAVKWNAGKTEYIKDKLAEVGKGKLWHLYRLINGIPINEHRIGGYSTIISDGSRDFDNWLQYRKYAKAEAVRGKY